MRIITLFVLILLSTLCLYPQVTKTDYDRADSTEKFKKLVYNGHISPVWIDSTDQFWYEVKTRKGDEYFIVNANGLNKKEAFDQKKLSIKLASKFNKPFGQYSLPIINISFRKNLAEMIFTLDSNTYKVSLKDYTITKTGKVEPQKEERYWGETDDELSNKPEMSGDSDWVAFIKNYNVFIKNNKTNEEYQLSFDGSEGEYYSSFIYWSPDSKYFVTNKIRKNVKHFIYFVESSPKNQLQPILQKREYLKPGDALPIKSPALFSVNEKKQVQINTRQFDNQYDVSNLKWWNDSRGFTFEYNQRGHQVYQVAEVNPKNASLRIVIDEQSNTFIDYSGKYYRFDLNDGREIIWASERDGWNHLYLYNGLTGEIKNQITKGDWVVRGVEYVDTISGFIILKGSGKNPGEDPYLIHYYRVNFDGSGLIDLTPENANHEATFSSNHRYFIDEFSRVDLATVSLLKDASNGRTLMKLESADISDLLTAGWKAPEVFVTKGRDQKTDIWGIIYRPTNFDSTKIYPVIEYIYAGPQGSFVPKSFQPYFYPFSGLAELGFIIVQIDGMGTSDRSRAFHDICWKNLKDAGLPDRILWIKEAAKKYHYLDTTRVGIFGGSAGGQNTLSALLFHSEFYKAGVSSCGCHDNRMDKMWWNEQWMGYPIGPQYAECSNVENAWKLKGRLLLIVGEVDDNVDPSSTMQVVNALVKANKDFELLVLPGVNHTLGGKFGERKRRDFFVRYLLNENPPDWNSN